MTRKLWWQRLLPPVERLAEPGSGTATATGVFLAYASPVVLMIAPVPLFGGEIWTGLGVVALAIGCWFMGHWLVSR